SNDKDAKGHKYPLKRDSTARLIDQIDQRCGDRDVGKPNRGIRPHKDRDQTRKPQQAITMRPKSPRRKDIDQSCPDEEQEQDGCGRQADTYRPGSCNALLNTPTQFRDLPPQESPTRVALWNTCFHCFLLRNFFNAERGQSQSSLVIPLL